MTNSEIVDKLQRELDELKNNTPEFVDGRRAAKILGIHESRLKHFRSKLGLPHVVLARRCMYRPTDLREWAASRVIREEVA